MPTARGERIPNSDDPGSPDGGKVKAHPGIPLTALAFWLSID
jgi:hypothetical protein